MPIIKKPDHTIFASEAKKGELSDFPNLLRGWGVTIDQTAGKPPMEWFNTLQKRTDEWLVYLSQRGISEWDNTLDYPPNAVVQSKGHFYVSIRENKAKAPDKSQSDWQPMADALNIKIEEATLKKKGIVQLSSATDSDSETMAATPKAVKAAYDMAASPAVKSVNGKKGEVRLTPDDIEALPAKGTAVAANRLAIPRKINGVPFDGSADIGVNTLVSRGLVPALSGNNQGTAGIQMYEAYNNGYPTPYGNVIHLKGAAAGGEGELLMGWDGASGAHAPLYIRSRRDVGRAHWSAWAQVFTANELAGIPLPFPGEVPPSGWLKCNGQAFNKTTYPVLASYYPTGKLPDLRGEFIRGWDDGRKVDTGRKLLSAQGDTIRNITGTQYFMEMIGGVRSTGVFKESQEYAARTYRVQGDGYSSTVDFDASRVVPTADENRPRNIAFNYIVRAA